MKKILITLNFLLVVTSNCQSDLNFSTIAYPEIGWDSLASLIQRPENYPEIPRRAGVTGRLSVYLTIDSTGKFLKVEPAQIPTNEGDSLINRLFIPSIWNVLKSVKWVPSKKNDRAINDNIYLLFNFYLFEPWERTFDISAPKYYERKN